MNLNGSIMGISGLRKDKTTFPLMSVTDLKLTDSEAQGFKKEMYLPFPKDDDLTEFYWPQSSNHCFLVHSVGSTTSRFVKEEILLRYEFSQ